MYWGKSLRGAKYVATSEGVSSNADKLGWWNKHEANLPRWSRAHHVRVILLIQPSSVAAEWLFSLLSNSFSDGQTSSMEDYVKTLAMLVSYFVLSTDFVRIMWKHNGENIVEYTYILLVIMWELEHSILGKSKAQFAKP